MSHQKNGDKQAEVDAANYDRVKHLEMIQAVISRLGNEAALIRGWALTVSSAFFAFAAQNFSWRVAAVGLLPVVAFWGLNAYYLRAERQYRKLYDRVRKRESNEPFLMNARDEGVESWIRTSVSVTLWPFYGVIMLVGVLTVIAGAFRLGAPVKPPAESRSIPHGDTYYLPRGDIYFSR